MKNKMLIVSILVASFLILPTLSQAQVLIKIKPPVPKVVLIKPNPPKSNYIWISGHWNWNKKKHQYVWQEGQWVKPKKGKVWVPGHYKNIRGGYTWIPGHWKRR